MVYGEVVEPRVRVAEGLVVKCVVDVEGESIIKGLKGPREGGVQRVRSTL